MCGRACGAYGEELFGPVATILRARDSEHALALANDNRYGLGASLWTGDARRGRPWRDAWSRDQAS